MWSRLAVLQFFPVLLVAPFALNVIGLGNGGLPAVATSDAHFQVKNRHSFLLPDERVPHSVSRRETPIVRLLFVPVLCQDPLK